MEFYIDETLMSHPLLFVHPMDNCMTVEIGTIAMLELLERQGHSHEVLPLSFE